MLHSEKRKILKSWEWFYSFCKTEVAQSLVEEPIALPLSACVPARAHTHVHVPSDVLEVAHECVGWLFLYTSCDNLKKVFM